MRIGESTYLLLHRGIQIVVCLLIATSLIDEWTGHLKIVAGQINSNAS